MKLHSAHIIVFASLAILVVATSTTMAQPEGADKSIYSLGNPTPRPLMRELSADRPDATESPFTVDAGHVQVEMSFFDYSRDKSEGTKEDVRTFFETNLKLGLTNHVDVQFIIAPYAIERTKPAGERSDSAYGATDLTVRLKVNLWGNDEGDKRVPAGLEGTALAIMPFLVIPTGGELSSDHVEGGIIIPFAMDLTENIGLGLMAEIDFVYDDADESYDVALVHTAVVGFDVVGPLGTYIEYVGILSADGDASYIAFLSTGLTFAVTEDLLLDAGIRVGLNDDAEDFGVFTGMTVRF